MTYRRAVLAAACVGLLTGCGPRPPATVSAPSTTATTLIATPTPAPSRPGFVLPDRTKTPGVTHGTDLADICPHVLPALERGRPGPDVKAKVYASYGITHRSPGQYEIDHLVPLELDGANDVRNLWPEPNDHPHATAYGHSVLNSKDLLENRFHALVCSHAVPLDQAQHDIATDWIAAYTRYVGPLPH